ncbi:YHYH domain-containing protein [Mesorhizobium sp. M0027]
MKIAILAALAAFILALATSAYAHSGGTDKNGCHTNHKTGEYHCH